MRHRTHRIHGLHCIVYAHAITTDNLCDCTGSYQHTEHSA